MEEQVDAYAGGDAPQVVLPGQVEERSMLPSFLYLAAASDFPKGDLSREIGFGELEEGLEVRCPNADPTPSAVAIARERWHQLVDNQPETVRRIVELRFMGATFPEIAEQLNIHERTARKAIERLVGEAVEEVEIEG